MAQTPQVTPNLGLNRWLVDSDPVNMEQHTEDNRLIDNFASRIYNPNLVINGALQIWQRGTSFTNPNNAYTADRMKCNGTGTVNAVGGTAPTGGMALTGNITVRYIMENIDFSRVSGQNITLSYSFDGNVTTSTYAADTTNCPVDGGGRRLFTISPGAGTLNWIKVEVGTAATAFVARSMGNETLLCKRYYHRFGGRVATTIAGIAGGYSATAAGFTYNLPVSMRTTPAFTTSTVASNNFTIVSGTTINITSTSFSATNADENHVYFGLIAASGVTTGTAYRFILNNSSFMNFDAEL